MVTVIVIVGIVLVIIIIIKRQASGEGQVYTGRSIIQVTAECDGASVITGLDYWTGLLDWTTGL